MKKLVITFFIILNANAEYRVYQYYIKSTEEKAQDKNGYIVRSSLDPITYRSYHGGPQSVQIDLLRTWRCPGNTGGLKSYCDSPYRALKKELLKAMK